MHEKTNSDSKSQCKGKTFFPIRTNLFSESPICFNQIHHAEGKSAFFC